MYSKKQTNSQNHYSLYSAEYGNYLPTRAREIVGFAGSGPIFETENRFISRQEAKKSVHKTLSSQDFAIHRLTLSPVSIVHT